MKKRDLIAAVAGALAATTLAGGVAWATIPDDGGVISGCYTKIGGILRVIDTTKNEKCFSAFEVPISWNQKGQKGDQGANGVSPTVTQLAAGNANCPTGGAALHDASGSTAYVCNGAAGADGQSFTGSFTSQNGEFSINVSDTGIKLSRGSGPSIEITANDVKVLSTGTAEIESSGVMTIKGSQVNIN